MPEGAGGRTSAEGASIGLTSASTCDSLPVYLAMTTESCQEHIGIYAGLSCQVSTRRSSVRFQLRSHVKLIWSAFGLLFRIVTVA